MNWEVISNERSSLQEYRLIDNKECKVVLKYNPRHQTARLSCGHFHRLFFLESAGSLSGKTIFKNEYGMETGNLVYAKLHPQEGTLFIDDKKYQYQFEIKPSPKLLIFEDDLQIPVASCRIPTNITPHQKAFSVNTQLVENNCYLIGLCWYLYLPLIKENLPKYASAGF